MADHIFAITGATGAGKSTVSELFRKNGVYVSDADKAARLVCEKGSSCLKELTDEFGNEILNKDGTLNRPALGAIVFNDRDKLDILNSITHKYIKAYIENEIAKSGAAIAAIDGAVIIGSPVEEMCEKIVVVTADKDTRIKRIMRRDCIDRSQAEQRISSQMSDGEYICHADYVIENNENSYRQGEQVGEICSEIKNLQKTRSKKETKA